MSNKKRDRNYKATFILDTRGYGEPVETLIEKLTGVLEGLGSKVKEAKNLGQKSFARITDKKFPAGIYVEMQFEGAGTVPSALAEKLKLDKTVNRVLVESI